VSIRSASFVSSPATRSAASSDHLRLSSAACIASATRVVFEVKPATTQTFPGDELVPEHGLGYGAEYSSGVSVRIDSDGSVTVECPETLDRSEPFPC
jgi:hypothetical protein